MKTAIKKGILGKKLGMTQVFDETGLLTPVTVIEAGPCVVTQKKTIETDGYDAIQIGFTDAKLKQTNKPFRGHFEKAGLAPKKYIREFRLADVGAFDVGAELKADVFTAGELVDVTGISKGKGFQGPIKRHGQHRGPMTHGSKYHRGPGSLSSATTPGRVKKGKKLAGHMGNKRRTIQNLVIVRVDGEKNYLLIKGAVPGARGSLIIVKAR